MTTRSELMNKMQREDHSPSISYLHSHLPFTGYQSLWTGAPFSIHHEWLGQVPSNSMMSFSFFPISFLYCRNTSVPFTMQSCFLLIVTTSYDYMTLAYLLPKKEVQGAYVSWANLSGNFTHIDSTVELQLNTRGFTDSHSRILLLLIWMDLFLLPQHWSHDWRAFLIEYVEHIVLVFWDSALDM